MIRVKDLTLVCHELHAVVAFQLKADDSLDSQQQTQIAEKIDWDQKYYRKDIGANY